MKLPLDLVLLSATLLGACAHGSPPDTSTTTLTSTVLPRSGPMVADDAIDPATLSPMTEWAWRYPEAARELGAWLTLHPEVAPALARWELAHREQLEALVDRAETHAREPLDSYLVTEGERGNEPWRELRSIDGTSGDLHGFLAWIRRALPAARELAHHADGLAFAREHAAALARMRRTEVEMRALRPVPETPGAAPLPGEPVSIAPKDSSRLSGAGVGPPLE